MLRPATVLVWRVTERCDTACPFCAYDASLRRSRRELDEAEARRFGALAAAWTELLVSWLGGEPFLWRPLVPVSRALAAAGARIGVTTNGRALAEPRWLDFALEDLDELTLSIDGLPEHHEALRGRPSAPLLAALRTLRRRRQGGRPLLRVNTVVMRRNVGTFAAFAGQLADAGADELTWNALGGNDRPEFFPENRLRPADLEALAGALGEVRGIRVRGSDGYLARLGAAARGEPVPVDDCGPGRSFWFGEVDGTLAPCSFTSGALGVPTRSLVTPADLDALPARFAEARRRRLPTSCADCPSTQVHAKWA